ncbi:hypothetical protein HPB51_014464 [Rhipicephalus microplus]|uniref:Uncharacterized protein n=1 Tax=Rhipicephalus microplus TaxID=6941 RepID=A0A9J6D5K2_RHIMP|nr:hypothetical protein HPB51_014464 [Rhipicephalus microplus]
MEWSLCWVANVEKQPDPDASQITGHIDFLKEKKAALSRQPDDVILAETDEGNLHHDVETADEYNAKILYAMSRFKLWLQEREKATTAEAEATTPGLSNLEFPNSGEAAGQTYFLMWRFDAIGELKRSHELQTRSTAYLSGSKVFPQEKSAMNLSTRSPVTGSRKRLRRRASRSMLITAVCVDVIGTGVLVTPDLNNSSQTSHLWGDHHDRHRVFLILHAEYVRVTRTSRAASA